MFTYRYSQPDEYHFSLDSIHFAEFVAKQIATYKNLSTLRVLDLCAGCGVIGLELSWYRREIRYIDFVEIQTVYHSYFNQNVALVNRPELLLQWYNINYDELLTSVWTNKYDLIVSNPPYFFVEDGILSPSQFKNRCRFYIDSTFNNFVNAIENTLKNEGEAYIILRPLSHHGYDLLSEIKSVIKNKYIKANKINEIRSHDIIFLKK